MTLDGKTERPNTTGRVLKLKSRQFMKLSTYNVRTLLRPGRLRQLTSGCKALNLDVVAIQEYRWRSNEETKAVKTEAKNFLYSTVTDLKEELDCWFLKQLKDRHILHIKSISNRQLLVTIDCNPKVTNISSYDPTEGASAKDKDTFYNNLIDCLRDISLHNFIVMIGDLNARAGSSDTHRKAVGRYTYHQIPTNNGNRLIDLCEANNSCIATTRKPYPNRHKWRRQDPNGNKALLYHVIIRRK